MADIQHTSAGTPQVQFKSCTKCQQTKSITEYYTHRGMRERTLSACKECVKASVKANRERNVEYYRQFDRERSKDPVRKASVNLAARKRRAVDPEPARLRQRKYEQVNAERCRTSKENYRKRARVQSRARYAVSNALRSGKLTRKPCVVCGSSKSEAHHEDYAKPLDVIWLCRRHHADIHSKVRLFTPEGVTRSING